VARLKKQLADTKEIAYGLREQIDTTLAQSDTMAAERDKAKAEAESLRKQRDALQTRVAELQRSGTGAKPAPAPSPGTDSAPLREQLAAVTAARDALSADARNLARELQTIRAERDKFQASAVISADRNLQLMNDINACRSGQR